MPQTFDRIVSVGMFEHVGINHFRSFFEVLHRSLAPDGVGAGARDRPQLRAGRDQSVAAPNTSSPAATRPALSEVMPVVERSGLIATDIEILRLHYAKTLRMLAGEPRSATAT